MAKLNIQNDVCLQSLNTMAVPALASYLVEVATVGELALALEHARRHELALCILGEGSNTIFSSHFDGLVVLVRIKGIERLEENEEYALIRVGAGENWHEFVRTCIASGWYGLENLALIPGLVGASPVQNIGAYGVEVQSVIERVEIVNIATGENSVINNDACEFSYRDSIFKNKLQDKIVITSVVFKLQKQEGVSVSYPSLAAELNDSPSPKQVFDAVCKVRSSKLPAPAEVPNSGSFFKNPIVGATLHQRLLKQYPPLVSYPVGAEFKLAAAWLIDNAGWKEREEYGVFVHQKQALVVINPQCLLGRKVLEFAYAIQQDVLVKFDVLLEIEPKIVA